jgi:hypothetical protein
MDEAQAQLLYIPYPKIFHVTAFNEDISLVFDILTNDDLHERGLSCTVLSTKSVYLATGNLEVQFLQGPNTGKGFRNPFGLDYDVFLITHWPVHGISRLLGL